MASNFRVDGFAWGVEGSAEIELGSDDAGGALEAEDKEGSGWNSNHKPVPITISADESAIVINRTRLENAEKSFMQTSFVNPY